MASTSIKTTDYATPVLKSLYAQVAGRSRRRFVGRLGKTAERVLQDHFRHRDSEGNKQGWHRSHFWLEIARATAMTSFDEKGAEVTIADPRFAAKRFGAEIRPTPPRKFLALPMNSEAKEAGSPSSGRIPGLYLIRGKKGKAWLATRDDRSIKFFYLLVKRVRQRADPRALPEPFYVNFEMVNAARKFLAREANKNHPPETN